MVEDPLSLVTVQNRHLLLVECLVGDVDVLVDETLPENTVGYGMWVL